MLLTPLQRRRILSIFQKKRIIPCVCRRDIDPPEYAIREITLNSSNTIVDISKKTLSPKATSSAQLAETLRQLISHTESWPVRCGDTGRSFSKDEVEGWLTCIGKPVLKIIEE